MRLYQSRTYSRFFIFALLFILISNLYLFNSWSNVVSPTQVSYEQPITKEFFLNISQSIISESLSKSNISQCTIYSPNEKDENLITKVKNPRKIPPDGKGPEFSSLKDGILTVQCDGNALFGTGPKKDWKPYKNPTAIDTEYIWASCIDHLNVHVQNIVRPALLNSVNPDPSKINVLIFIQDSVSRSMFYRRYNDSSALFKKINEDKNSLYKFYDFKLYHALGSNSLPNKGPIFGNFCWEKSCTHRWQKYEEHIKDLFLASGSLWANGEPNHTAALTQDWIWKYYKNQGYITMYGEEESGEGRNGKTFGPHSILSFFQSIPEDMVNILFPSTSIAENNQFKGKGVNCGSSSCPSKIMAATHSQSCVGHQFISNLAVEYIKEFLNNYYMVPFFGGFMFNVAHGSEPEALQCADYYFNKLFSWILTNEKLENTIILFLADHGQKMGQYFTTPSGITENLLPHLFFFVSKKLVQKYPQLDVALTTNQNKLSTPHDLYVTLKHLAIYPKELVINNTYSKSMLLPLPNRNCYSCGIPNNWCLCHKWKDISEKYVAQYLAEFVIKKLNEYVQEGKSVCKILTLKEVLSVKMTDDPSLLSTYKLEFSVVASRQMTFRAFVTVTESGELWMDQWDIAQITKWGPYVKCKPDKVRPPIEEQFCIC